MKMKKKPLVKWLIVGGNHYVMEVFATREQARKAFHQECKGDRWYRVVKFVEAS
jgi:hypothetical protein